MIDTANNLTVKMSCEQGTLQFAPWVAAPSVWKLP